MKTHELTTPALVVEVSVLEANLDAMAQALPGARLRPHVKAHKCTSLAAVQSAHGHHSFTCATPREVLGMAAAGLGDDLLLANEVLDPARLAALARAQEGARITVAVDSAETIDAAAHAGLREVLVDVNVGLPRCGVDPEGAGRLADLARGSRHGPDVNHWGGQIGGAGLALLAIRGDPGTDPAKVDVPRIWYEEPVYYKCNRFAVVGTGTDVICPSYCKKFDYELEFGIVLGKRGKNITRETARDYIFGYCIFNDFSARDQQMREMQSQLGPTKGKDFDTGNVLGPWLVTADEIADPYALTMTAKVNGVEWSRGVSGDMHHKFEDILVHVSRDETVYPGEFLGSGTVGSGCGLEHGKFLAIGDTVELEVTGLGRLTNMVVASA